MRAFFSPHDLWQHVLPIGLTGPSSTGKLSLPIVLLSLVGIAATCFGAPVSHQWQKRVSGIAWVCYVPPTSNPESGIQAIPAAIREDLAVLKNAGFTGLITYGGSEAFVRQLVAEAETLGFQGMIIGVWNPESARELATAQAVSKSPIVLGYCVGNEGYERRYSRSALLEAIDQLRRTTAKPIATTEEFDDYTGEQMWGIGDWVFPNAHPYFHGRFDPEAAVRWTGGAYNDLQRRSGRFVWFKEVGLPTAGAKREPVSEAAQHQYYVELAKTPVMFAYFEAFDQPWKSPGTIEPHWGIFRSDRSPKKLGDHLLSEGVPLNTSGQLNANPPRQTDKTKPHQPPREPFYVYLDHSSPRNHFTPQVLNGDLGDVTIDNAHKENPRSGETCLSIAYQAKGSSPNECSYPPPCMWAFVGWRQPPGNTGKDPAMQGKGYDLSGYRRLSFWARADAPCTMKFGFGGLDTPYGDSLLFPRRKSVKLTQTWQKFEIALDGADLRHIVSGFGWETNWDTNPNGATFYLDDIRFE